MKCANMHKKFSTQAVDNSVSNMRKDIKFRISHGIVLN